MRNCFQSPLEGRSETSNDQAPFNPFYHYIKMKAYMRVEGWGGGTLPFGRLSPPPPLLTIFRDKIGEIVSSILLKGIQKLQMTRLFSIPLIIT